MSRWRSVLRSAPWFLLATVCWTQALAAYGGFAGIALGGASRWGSLPLALLGIGLAGVAIVSRPRTLGMGAIAGIIGGVTLVAGISACTHLYPDRRFLPPEAGAKPDASFTVTALAGDGDALWIAPRARSSGVVVLVHGTGNDRLYGFWYLIDALVARGYSVLTANLPGHGRGGTDTFDLAACRARLDALASRARQLGSPVFVLGQSLGGALVLDAVARRADFAGFIAVSAPLEVHVGATMLRELGALTRPAVYRALRYGTIADVLPAAGSFRRAEFPVRVHGTQSYVHAIAEVVSEMALANRLAALATPSVPVLLVHGEQDGVVSIAQARGTASALHGRADALFGESVHHLDPLFDEAIVRSVVDWIAAHTD